MSWKTILKLSCGALRCVALRCVGLGVDIELDTFALFHSTPFHMEDSSETTERLVRKAFGKKTLYEIIGVERDATATQIKKAYYRLALRMVRDCGCVLPSALLVIG